VGELSDFTTLQAFYAAGDDNDVVLGKIEQIKASHRAMRPVKGDGNCFYRAYMFAIFESVLLHPSAQLEAKTLIDKLRGFYDQMISPSGLGYQAEAIELFFDDAIKPLTSISEGKDLGEQGMPTLLSAFCDYAISNAIVVFARLICSCYLQQQEEMFAPFLAADGLTVKDFATREVEPLDKEVEQIQMMALCQALDVPLRIAYLDRSLGALNFHDLLDAHPKASTALRMLYRPGHYDLIYAT